MLVAGMLLIVAGAPLYAVVGAVYVCIGAVYVCIGAEYVCAVPNDAVVIGRGATDVIVPAENVVAGGAMFDE